MDAVQQTIFWEQFKNDHCNNCEYPYGCGLKQFAVQDIVKHVYYKDLVEEIEKKGKCKLFTKISG